MNDTSPLFDAETTSTILKWAITILIAGFIAQFGKKIADYITERLRNLKKRKAGAAESAPEASNNGPRREDAPQRREAAAEKARLKLEKKAAKAKSKRMKKGS